MEGWTDSDRLLFNRRRLRHFSDLFFEFLNEFRLRFNLHAQFPIRRSRHGFSGGNTVGHMNGLSFAESGVAHVGMFQIRRSDAFFG